MKKNINFTLILFLSISFIEVYAQHHEHHHGKHITLIEEEKNIKIVIDIMDQKSHEHMMKSMKVKMKENIQDEHHIMITLLDKSNGNMIGKAQINGFITGKNFKKDLKFQEMNHDNMLHYGTHVKLKSQEKYKLNLSIKIKDKTINRTLEFEL